jgi:uroporphyrinogen III methyltransferase/synthase
MQHIIFTSINGVQAFFERLKVLKIDIRKIGEAKIYAIGSATKEALEAKGVLVDKIPEVYTAEGVLEAVKELIQAGDRVLLPRADIARKVLTEGLRAMGALVEEIDIYRTTIPSFKREDLLEILKVPVDCITFTSSSTVRNFMEILGEENKEIIKDSKLAAIGPITSHTAKTLGLEIAIEAEKYTIEELVKRIREVSDLEGL